MHRGPKDFIRGGRAALGPLWLSCLCWLGLWLAPSTVWGRVVWQERSDAAGGAAEDGSRPARSSTDPTLPQVAQLLPPPANLPSDSGQVWRTYDLAPYTRRITTVRQPEQAVVDWILRDTGTEMWFRQPLGLMSVAADRLHVYHTPEVHKVVAAMVDRLVESKGRKLTLGIRLVTVGRADWRAAAFPYIQPFDVQTPGVEGWLISKENAAILANQLAMRNDFRALEVGDLVLPEGQSHSFKRLAPQSYIRSLQYRALNPSIPAAGGQYEPLTSRLEEGYTLDVSPLGMLDQRMMEVVIRCQIDQLEKLQTVTIPVPTLNGQMQNLSTSVPQVVSWRLHERFRWPRDQVLLLSCGVIATPSGQGGGPSLLNLGTLVGQQRGRADALLFVEFKGNQSSTGVTNNQAGEFRPNPSTTGPFPSGGMPGSAAPSTGAGFPPAMPSGGAGGTGNGSAPGRGGGQPGPLSPSQNPVASDGFRATLADPNGGGGVNTTAGSGLYPIISR